MDFEKLVIFLVEAFGVKSRQVMISLKAYKPFKFRGFSYKEAEFEVSEDNPDDFADQCNGKCPIKLFHVKAVLGRKKRQLTVYSHVFFKKGEKKLSVTTSPKKERRWDPYPD